MTLPASAPGPCTWPDRSLQSSKLALSLPSLGLCGFRIQSKLLSWSVSSHLLPSAQRNLPVRPASAQPHSAPSRPGLASAVLSAWSAFPAQPVPVTLCGSALLASGNPLSPFLPTHTPASAYGDTPLLCFPQSPRVSPHQGIPAVEEVTTRAHTSSGLSLFLASAPREASGRPLRHQRVLQNTNEGQEGRLPLPKPQGAS